MCMLFPVCVARGNGLAGIGGEVSSDVRVLECKGMTSAEGESQRTHISHGQHSPLGLSHTLYLY